MNIIIDVVTLLGIILGSVLILCGFHMVLYWSTRYFAGTDNLEQELACLRGRLAKHKHKKVRK